ncbi:hypothetical protein TSMG0163 [Halocynthia phage JM-2012]|uniref:hypothetical protein n=1 Tax=Halocynthia phage JM-2012 TaxID=1173297 RepID=UPI00025C697F|nr:hypothetical protein TSMG0163 [Halocynthia phage JM-2012]AFI55446.1 hypothetical protein TSMG0163 [Halocynthia phage JM-2012]
MNNVNQVIGTATNFMNETHILSSGNTVAGVILCSPTGTTVGFDKAFITITTEGVERSVSLTKDNLIAELSPLFTVATVYYKNEDITVVLANNGNWLGVTDDGIYFGKDIHHMDDSIILEDNSEKLITTLNHYSVMH